MISTTHTPPRDARLAETDLLLFLAGPIQGAPDWQKQTIQLLETDTQCPKGLHVANPRREVLDKNFVYTDQTRWERAHLYRAAAMGVVIFNLARQDPNQPYRLGRAYGQTTRFEFGMMHALWKTGQNPHVSLAIEPGYSGSENYYRDCADEMGLVVHDNLEALCLDAISTILEIERR